MGRLPRFAGAVLACGLLAAPGVAHAKAAALGPDASFVLNSLFLLICGALVMFMASGFTLLEAGSVRAKSVGAILIKNIALYAIAGIMFFLVGYRLLFDIDPGGFVGTIGIWSPGSTADKTEPAAYADNAI